MKIAHISRGYGGSLESRGEIGEIFRLHYLMGTKGRALHTVVLGGY